MRAGFFLSPCACHDGIIAQALELNGPGFECQVIIFHHFGQDTYLYEPHLSNGRHTTQLTELLCEG